MPNHQIGHNYKFSDLLAAYKADPQGKNDAHFLLYRGDEILALCLRYKYNHDPKEVWVGDDRVVAEWGRKLAALKGKKTLPVYYSPRGRTLYEFKGHHFIAGDTEVAAELSERTGPVPLSRIVFIMPLDSPEFAHRN
jgi:hypothetical protein